MEQGNILIVEDEEVTRDLLKDHIIEYITPNVFVAKDGYEAKELLKKTVFDILLLDMNLPGIKGKEVLVFARELYKDMDIFVTTKFNKNSALLAELNIYNAVYVQKHTDMEEIENLIRAALAKKGKLNP